MATSFQIERRFLEPAPNLAPHDVISMTEAAQILGVTYNSLHSYIYRGTLTAVYDTREKTAHKRLRRWVLAREVEELRRQREQEGDGAERENASF